jgi:hypothetical protein
MAIRPKINLFKFMTNSLSGIPWHWLGNIAEWAAMAAIIGIIGISAIIVFGLHSNP